MKKIITILAHLISLSGFANSDIVEACKKQVINYPFDPEQLSQCINSGVSVEIISMCRRSQFGDPGLSPADTLACIKSGASVKAIDICKSSTFTYPALSKPEIMKCIKSKVSDDVITACRGQGFSSPRLLTSEVFKCINSGASAEIISKCIKENGVSFSVTRDDIFSCIENALVISPKNIYSNSKLFKKVIDEYKSTKDTLKGPSLNTQGK